MEHQNNKIYLQTCIYTFIHFSSSLLAVEPEEADRCETSPYCISCPKKENALERNNYIIAKAHTHLLFTLNPKFIGVPKADS